MHKKIMLLHMVTISIALTTLNIYASSAEAAAIRKHSHTVSRGIAAMNVDDDLQTMCSLAAAIVSSKPINNLQPTDLHRATDTNDIRAIQTLLDHGASADIEDPYGFTPLHLAVMRNNDGAIQALMAKKPSLKNLTIALRYAQSKGNKKLVQALCDAGAQPTAPVAQEGFTLLHAAASNNDIETLQELTAQGVDINLPDNAHHRLPLHYAAEKGHIRALQFLLDHGAEKNGGFGRRTALYHAVEHNQLESVQTLIRAGSNVNTTTTSGISALMCGIEKNCDLSIIMALLEAGANVNTQDVFRRTALRCAIEKGRTDIITILLNHRADVTVSSAMFGTIIQCATSQNNPEIVQALLNAGANPNQKAEGLNDSSALRIATLKGNIDIVRMLLAAGAKPDIVTSPMHDTELMIAIRHNRLDIVQALVRAGANVNYSNAYEIHSILEIAMDKRYTTNTKMADFLRAHGAKRSWFGWMF